MATRRCPKCALINPGTAQRCDCGYSFADGTMGQPLAPKLSEDQLETKRRLRMLAPLVAGVGFSVIALVVRTLIHSGYRSSDKPFIVVFGGFGALLIGLGVAMRFAKR